MSRQNFLHKTVMIFCVIVGCALLGCGETEDTSSIALSETAIAGDTTTFAGRAVDELGNPVVGLALVIQPLEIDNDTGVRTSAPTIEVETDDAGHFSITNIPPGEFQFMLAPEYQNGLPTQTEYQLLSVKIGAFAYYPTDLFPFSLTQDAFSITSGKQIENVEVTVRLRMRIRAKIVFADGTPLANKAVDINIRTFDSHSGNVVGGIQGAGQTNAQGYFVQYVDENGATGYRVSVEYHGLCATSEDFVLKVGERREDLILKLTGTLK